MNKLNRFLPGNRVNFYLLGDLVVEQVVEDIPNKPNHGYLVGTFYAERFSNYVIAKKAIYEYEYDPNDPEADLFNTNLTLYFDDNDN